ncbi:MAG: hypothetical protein GX780_08355, partial [Campylobacteraceae bacterium]|nr:hypothetical protein [Campylobacteraceae bacterium]
MEQLLKKTKSCTDINQATVLLGEQIKITAEIEKAIDFTIEKHEGQKRKSGEPYSVHP